MHVCFDMGTVPKDWRGVCILFPYASGYGVDRG